MKNRVPPTSAKEAPLPGKRAASTHGIGRDGADLPTTMVREHLLMLEPSLRLSGTPRAMTGLNPGECKVPGGPNKTSSRPITTPHAGMPASLVTKAAHTKFHRH